MVHNFSTAHKTSPHLVSPPLPGWFHNNRMQNPRVTEIQVRMDCNGCVQKIKKALNGINGIYDFYIDFPQQKLKIIGWTDPKKIIKAIKKTGRIATICSDSEATDQPVLAQDDGSLPPPPPPDARNPPAAEARTTETPPPSTEPPKDQPQLPPLAEPKDQPLPAEAAASETKCSQLAHSSGPKDLGEVHVVHHHPPDYGNGHAYGQVYSHGGHWSSHPAPVFRQEQAQPVYMTHSYRMYQTSPYITQYDYIQSPQPYTAYARMEQYNISDLQRGSSNNNGNIISIFSDENPNACTIV
ncbi:hypothetical protein Nepgr_010415 [Nepenthes gracilis]|uniref:HMA domain-containing protein n=1 Tax=Nepenthes gracilis TaxID=150966 RepID=A0AAD3SD17_NEPGR|nr:hypothetical protein Nepgr_010415 [Nepenthes gracilis]